MPVYLLTYHAYRSWSPADPRGYVRRVEKRVRPTNAALAHCYDRRARQEPVRFGRRMQRTIIDVVREACERRDWRLHGNAVTLTHVHVLLSWRRGAWKPTSDTLKRLIGFGLGTRVGPRGQRWLSRGESRKRVRDRANLTHLLTSYLPKHEREGGMVWREADVHCGDRG